MIINEQNKTYDIELEFSLFGANGCLQPSGYQYIMNSVADKHLRTVDLNFEKILETGLSWVLLSMTVDVLQPIDDRLSKLVGTTWYSGRKGVFFRREINVAKEDGTPVFHCATYSTLLDMKKRSIFRGRELPFEMMEPTDKLLVDAVPTFKEKHDFEKGVSRNVQRSYIDGVGHVNNGRYGEFCFDALTDSEAATEKLRRMEIYFVSEMRLGETFAVGKAYDNEKIILQGYNETQEKPAFYGVFKFD